MSGQIQFFKKSKSDYSYSGVTATASQGSAYAPRVLNRSNRSSWTTTGSVDADNTTLTIDMADAKNVSSIFLIKHNFKSYTVKYWDGSAYQAFSPAITETSNTAETNSYTVAQVNTSKIQVTITGTQTANQDKFLYQFVATELLGQLSAWPVINAVIHDKRRTSIDMLSGKRFIFENIGGFSCDLSVSNLKNDADLTLIESLYSLSDGFLVWLSGGNETQFSSSREGYRLEDLFLMKCQNNYEPNFVEGLYFTGLEITVSLTEATN